MPDNPNPHRRPHPYRAGHDAPTPLPPVQPQRSSPPPAYAELCVTSNYTFLTGASHPDELVRQAAALGHRAIAITDRNTLAGIVRAHVAAKEAGIPLVVGCRVETIVDCESRIADYAGHTNNRALQSAFRNPQSAIISLLLYPTDRAAYGRLCRLLTLGKRRTPKGQCFLTLHDVIDHSEGLLAIVVPPAILDEHFVEVLLGLKLAFAEQDLAMAARRKATRLNEDAIKPALHDSQSAIPSQSAIRNPKSEISPPSDIRNAPRLSLAAAFSFGEDDRLRLAQLAALADHTDIPLVATNDVLYHVPQRRALQDVVTCIRLGCTLDEAGDALNRNAERHLKSPEEMARLFAEHPQAIARTVEIAEWASGSTVERDHETMRRRDEEATPSLGLFVSSSLPRGFNLDELRYEYPEEVCPPGTSAMRHLKDLTWSGAIERYCESTPGDRNPWAFRDSIKEPSGDPQSLERRARHCVPAKIVAQIEHEFELIEELNYAKYFLTVHDLIVFARSRGILCQGRGAAANSAVCFCLGITAVDPERIDLLFERFVSRQRNEPPDIDIDFEHERREEVIQYIYAKYGRDRAALTAEVISYRGRSAVREVGKALGLSLDCVDRLVKNMDWWEHGQVHPNRIAELGLNPDDSTLRHFVHLAVEIQGFPRHLSQHVGGFVITAGPLCECVPIENAAMNDRTIIEWDKDDIDAMGMLKVDCLGLGMLTCISRAFAMIEGSRTKRRRDEERKRESVPINPFSKESSDGECQNLPRPDCLAEEHGTGKRHLSPDHENARIGTIRSDEPDEAVGSVRPIEHRRGIWAREQSRPAEASTHRSRIAERAINPIRTRHHDEDGAGLNNNMADDSGGGSSASRIDSQHGPQERLAPTSSLPLSVSPSLSLYSIPPEDPRVYDAICAADTIGVFQIESRAQMSMLPRLRPRCYYDLVIEVAIVRPGPIQGDMVHPYLRRRNGEEPVSYPKEEVRQVLGKTLGVPLFQEQAMALAIVAAGFTPGEADQLRRAIAAWKSKQKILFTFGQKLIDGMVRNGYERDFAERCFNQIKGFSEYGFPESHAASFALLVYISAWLKVHHPAAFAGALINSQPMGFYAPAQIVRDAQQHGVEVRAVDVNRSGWDCLLETRDEETERRRDEAEFSGDSKSRTNARSTSAGPFSDGACPALRLGMRLVKGLRREEADRIAAAVAANGPFATVLDLWRISGVQVATLRRLASADAFQSMGLDRQHALWMVRELRDERLPLFEGEDDERDGETERGRDEETERQRNEEMEREEQKPSTHHTYDTPSLRLSVSPSLPHSSSLLSFLPPIPAPRKVVQDYNVVGLSLKAHPLSFIRDQLGKHGVTANAELTDEARWPDGAPITVAGLVLVRQRPGTASGVVFVTLEDETGIANLIIRPRVFEMDRKAAKHATVALARGRVERQGQVVHVMVHQVQDITDLMRELLVPSRDFH